MTIKNTDLPNEEEEMGAEEFLAIAAKIRSDIKTSTLLKDSGRKDTLEVLDGIIESVKAHGIRKHGLTKKKKKVALTVFERLSREEGLTEKEVGVYNALLNITLLGIKQGN
jgi:hypothetical protein